MIDFTTFLGDIHMKDGILAVLVVWLLWTDRADRKADREFWVQMYKDKDKESK